MSASTQFNNLVLNTLYERLSSLGFHKRKHGILSLTVTNDLIGWLGLNRAFRRGPRILEINPVVGVRSQPVEKLVAEILTEPFDELIPPSLAGNVGYMMPTAKYVPFLFSESTLPDVIADDLTESIKRYGLPFITMNADLVQLLESMISARFAIPEQVAYRIPIILHLLGKDADAVNVLENKLKEFGGRVDPAALRFRKFCDHLQARIRVPY